MRTLTVYDMMERMVWIDRACHGKDSNIVQDAAIVRAVKGVYPMLHVGECKHGSLLPLVE